jgi:Bifunctional DNA primase/polymerase, N-terminal
VYVCTGYAVVENINFVNIALPLIQRGFRVTPVHPLTKRGVMKNWQNWQITTPEQLSKYAGGKYACHNVGVVGKRGVGRDMFLDFDAAGEIERIEKETEIKIPLGYRVQSSPLSKPWKIHIYLKQTAYSFKAFGGWDAVNSNVKDMNAVDEDGKHPTLYDVKGVGGGSLVVSAGSVRESGEVYTWNGLENIPAIPDWLVDWLIADIAKFWDAVDAETATKNALKTAEREKYTAVERAEMRRKNLPEGFDIYFEDRYEYIAWRSFSLSKQGLSKSLEAALTELAENDIAGGKEYVLTDKGKAMIHKLAHNSNLVTGNGSWFYLRKENRPPKMIPTVSGAVGTLFRKPFSLVEKLFAVIKNFPEQCLPAAEAYERIEDALLGTGWDGVPFNRKKNRLQVNRAMRTAGFRVEGRMWVRR